jgi:hypothetical protein
MIDKLKSFFNRRVLIGLFVGGAVGFAYYHFFGCTNGCSITSSPVNSTLMGMAMGALFLVKDESKKEKVDENQKVAD